MNTKYFSLITFNFIILCAQAMDNTQALQRGQKRKLNDEYAMEIDKSINTEQNPMDIDQEITESNVKKIRNQEDIAFLQNIKAQLESNENWLKELGEFNSSRSAHFLYINTSWGKDPSIKSHHFTRNKEDMISSMKKMRAHLNSLTNADYTESQMLEILDKLGMLKKIKFN